MPFFKRTAFRKALSSFLFAESKGLTCLYRSRIPTANSQTQAGKKEACIETNLFMVIGARTFFLLAWSLRLSCRFSKVALFHVYSNEIVIKY